MSAFEQALRALASLEAIGEQRREKIAAAVLAVIDAHTGGERLSAHDFEALDERLRRGDLEASEVEIEALFKTLLR